MIKANFSAYSKYVTDSLHQWDLNQTLQVSGLNLATAPEVHFSNANTDRAIVRQSTMENHIVSVAIPNSLLQEPFRIFAHIGLYEGKTFKVVELVEIPVIARKRPLDYQIEDTDEEVYSFKRLESLLANKTPRAETSAMSARIDAIVANANKTDGNSELVDMRVADDGTVYASAGAALRNHYARSNIMIMNFSGAVPLDFDFTNKKITIRAYTRVSHANRQIFNATEDIELPVTEAAGRNANHVLCFDLLATEFRILSQHDTFDAKLIPIAGYYYHQTSTAIMYDSLQCAYSYTIEGKAPDHEAQISISNSRHRFGLVGNAFGDPIDFDLANHTITLPTHSYLFDGETRLFYNGGEIGAVTVRIPDEPGVKALLYDLATANWEVRSYGGVFTKNVDTIMVATWWPDSADTIVCSSPYTVDGQSPKYADVVASVSDAVRAEIATDTGTLADKKVFILGDSISTDYYGNYEKWVTKLCTEGFFSTANVTNDSIHATGFVARYGDDANDFISRIKAVTDPDGYDLVVVFGGVNDYINNVPLGEPGGSDLSEFKPAVDHFFEFLVSTFSSARICVLSPMRTYQTWENTEGEYMQAYAEYIREVAEFYSLPVLNLTDESGFCPWVTSFREKWTLMPEGYDIHDGTHPTEEYGEKFLAPMIKKFLASLL